MVESRLTELCLQATSSENRWRVANPWQRKQYAQTFMMTGTNFSVHEHSNFTFMFGRDLKMAHTYGISRSENA